MECGTERLDQFLVVNGVADNTKKVTVFQTVIGDKAYGLLQDFLAPTKAADKTYSEPVKIMKDHLKPKPPVITERFKFDGTNETMTQSPSIWVSCTRSQRFATLKSTSTKP